MSQAGFAVAVTFEIKEGRADDFRAAVLRQGENARQLEAWCHSFHVCSDPEDPLKFFLYETYDDAEAFDKHCQTPHFAEYMAEVSDLIAHKQRTTWNIESL